jgi:hypothetical protein
MIGMSERDFVKATTLGEINSHAKAQDSFKELKREKKVNVRRKD